MKDNERAKVFLNSIANITKTNESTKLNISSQEDLVNNIIASINRIKNNITADKNNTKLTDLNEAIILNNRVNYDINTSFSETHKHKNVSTNYTGVNETNYQKTYIEILTIEPNNTSTNNSSSHNIVEVLKHLMPMFNNTMNKELHNITIIERNHNKNNSFSATKNISTIIVTYCDKDNLAKANLSESYENETVFKHPNNISEEFNIFGNTDAESESDIDANTEANLTQEEKRDILEAAEYGMQKMHELYSIMEPKLYSMGKIDNLLKIVKY